MLCGCQQRRAAGGRRRAPVAHAAVDVELLRDHVADVAHEQRAQVDASDARRQGGAEAQDEPPHLRREVRVGAQVLEPELRDELGHNLGDEHIQRRARLRSANRLAPGQLRPARVGRQAAAAAPSCCRDDAGGAGVGGCKGGGGWAPLGPQPLPLPRHVQAAGCPKRRSHGGDGKQQSERRTRQQVGQEQDCDSAFCTP